MLVHICCSVDSHFFLEKLQADFPDEKLTGFFYDPNIHPYSEYRLRYLDVQRSCKKLGIDLLEGEYDFETWMDLVRGLEKMNRKKEPAARSVLTDVLMYPPTRLWNWGRRRSRRLCLSLR